MSGKGIFYSLDTSINIIKKILLSLGILEGKENVLDEETQGAVKKIIIDLNRLYLELKTVPISLDKTYDIIKDIITTVHISRNQIKGAVDGLIKQTGEQLIKITTATEAATTKILDVSDALTEKQNDVIEKLDKILETHPELADELDDIKNDIYSQQDDTFMILDHLQFQDITSQQLEGAFGMLVQIEEKLLIIANLMEGLDNLTFEKLRERKKVYDVNAEFKDQKDTQKHIDSLFKVTKDDSDDLNVKNAQEDIDALFQSYNNTKVENNTNETDETLNKTNSDINQDEIDNLLKKYQ
ncbi:MAG: hypothetical protein JXR48_06805 [Candidatus Delongbacteria bacterium]|nr:hypothetical protein [Candidatus Delongbacteria bacterium]MBN2834660.1 hypothetical protein [Candidatus Delongbacteria bacterium]